jgi:hypothetical protein
MLFVTNVFVDRFERSLIAQSRKQNADAYREHVCGFKLRVVQTNQPSSEEDCTSGSIVIVHNPQIQAYNDDDHGALTPEL